MEKGKAYANRKKESDRPENDFYQTPTSLVKVLIEGHDDVMCGNIFSARLNETIFDPCCGNHVICNTIRNYPRFRNNTFVEQDIIYGQDFLAKNEDGTYVDDTHYDIIVMNPPFSLFDEFVTKAKIVADRIYCIGKIDYLNAHNRNITGLWNNLEWILPFDRKVAYDKPWREDGKFECGMLNTGWFVWDRWYYNYPKVKVLDVNDYVLRKGDE